METNKEPGVSGKDRSGKTWIDREKYQEQKEFLDEADESVQGFSTQGRGHNLYGRTDLSNQTHQGSQTVLEDQVIEALKRSPQSDISEVRVTVKGKEVCLEGLVEDTNESREIENIVMNVPGVEKVINHMNTRNQEKRV